MLLSLCFICVVTFKTIHPLERLKESLFLQPHIDNVVRRSSDVMILVEGKVGFESRTTEHFRYFITQKWRISTYVSYKVKMYLIRAEKAKYSIKGSTSVKLKLTCTWQQPSSKAVILWRYVWPWGIISDII